MEGIFDNERNIEDGKLGKEKLKAKEQNEDQKKNEQDIAQDDEDERGDNFKALEIMVMQTRLG